MSKKTSYSFAVLAIAAFAYVAVSVPDSSLAKNESPYALPESEGVYDVPGRPELKLKVTVYHGKDADAERATRGGKISPVLPELTCGNSIDLDQDSATVVKVAGWHLPSDWRYRVNSSSAPLTIGADDANSLITNAFTTWQNVMGTRTVFTSDGSTTVSAAKLDNQNIVTWGRAPGGSTLAITYTWYDTYTQEAVEIDTIMNNRYTWYWSDPSRWVTGEICAYQGVFDAQAILTHEIGHTVGLADEYDNSYRYNTMFGYGDTGETRDDTLAKGDISGVEAIYGLQ